MIGIAIDIWRQIYQGGGGPASTPEIELSDDDGTTFLMDDDGTTYLTDDA